MRLTRHLPFVVVGTWIAFVGLLSVAPGASADDEGVRTAREAYPAELVRHVPLDNVRGDVLWAAYGELQERGIAPNPRGLRSARFLRLLGERLFVQSALPTGEEETALDRMRRRAGGSSDPPAGRTGVATRYADQVGSVRGDGRAVTVDAIPLQQGSRPTTGESSDAVYEVQVKGVNTGLRPNGAPVDEVHGTGRTSTDQALHDAIMGEYLRLNGLAAERPLMAAHLGSEFEDSGRHSQSGKRVTNRKRAGLYARGGQFIRLAHLLAADGPGRRRLLDRIRRTEEALTGRPVRNQEDLLYRLVERKAVELADLFWLRVAHKSLTYDNQLFFGQGDLSTAEIVSRLHPSMGTATNEALGPGMGLEAPMVLELFVPELVRFIEGALDRDERGAWGKRRIASVEDAMALFERRMRHNVLEHVGLDPEEAALFAERRAPAVQRLLDAVRAVATRSADSKRNAADPARPQFDVLAALAVLPGALEAELGGRSGRATLERALSPDRETSAKETRAAAAELLGAARPVMDMVLRPFRGEARQAKIALMADRARRINAPIDKLPHNGHRRLASELIDARYGGVGGRTPAQPMSLHRIQSTIDRTVRDAIRRGPLTPDAVAVRIRRDEIETVDGWGTLARWVDHGVEVAERSNGREHAVRVRVSLRAWGDAKLEGATLEYRTQAGGEWKSARGRVRGGDLVFRVPVDAPIERFLARVKDQRGRVRLDNSGALYGTSAAVLGSNAVWAELGAAAKRRGLPAADRERPERRAARRAAETTARRVRPLRGKRPRATSRPRR